jgi:hypothetical protein
MLAMDQSLVSLSELRLGSLGSELNGIGNVTQGGCVAIKGPVPAFTNSFDHKHSPSPKEPTPCASLPSL